MDMEWWRLEWCGAAVAGANGAVMVEEFKQGFT